jgi:hypothetical protein
VTVLNIGGTTDAALARDVQQMFMQIATLLVSIIFTPFIGLWEILTDLTGILTGRAKWVFVSGLSVLAILLMHYYHYELLSIIDSGLTCTVLPILKNVITPLLQISRVFYAIGTPIFNAFLVIHGQIFKAWYVTLATCSHVNLFRFFSEGTRVLITASTAIASWFGVNDLPVSDENNFYYNDFEIDRPINHTLTAISVGEGVLSCACKRFEPMFNIVFFITQEPHITAAIDNGFQVAVRIFQMLFRILFKEFPRIHLVAFKLERAIMEGSLALDSILFNTLENIVKMFDADFKIKKRPTEALFTVGGHLASAAIHTSATIGFDGPLHLLATFDPETNLFDPELWSLDKTFSHLHASVYSSAVFVQWFIYVMERLVTDTLSIGDVFSSEETPLELTCDWARDVKDHKYVSIGYTAACSLFYFETAYLNFWHIVYGLSVELLTKSIFTQEQNVFRTLQRWEGPTLPRNKIYTCEERQAATAYSYNNNTHNPDGWIWTQDLSKCHCDQYYGTTPDEEDLMFNPWCGQPSLTFDVFSPLDALVMHVSHGVLGPGFGDAFPFVEPLEGVGYTVKGPDGDIVDKFWKFPMALPPLTRTAIETMRVMTHIVLSFGDIVTGHFFNYPVNCGHGLNITQLQRKWEVNTGKSSVGLTDETMRWNACKDRQYKPLKSAGKRTEICEKSNDSPDCMCSYMQPLTPQSKCQCISRYPDLDVTAAGQQVGDLIESRFTSEEVAIHWCNSMILEWTFQNSAAFANALDYIVSLGPINPTCDVMDRVVDSIAEGESLDTSGPDQRASSGYLMANTPTLRFLGEFMDSETKLNHIKSLYSSNSDDGCTIKPGGMVDTTDENGNPVLDEDGQPIQVMSQPEWSCDASKQYQSLAAVFEKTSKNFVSGETDDQPGCRIYGRNDFFCSAGLYVRQSKRLTMNIARQAVNDAIAIISGNFADVNLRTLPRLCDYERQQGAIAAMIAGIIPKLSMEMKQSFAKYLNMIAQVVFIQTMRTSLTLINMATTIIMDFVAGSITKDAIESTFRTGVDTIVDGYLWAFRYFWQTTGEILDAISPGAGDICESIVDIVDIVSKSLKEGLMDLVALALKVVFNALAMFTGDAGAVGEFFSNAFELWAKMQVFLIRQMFQILDKIYEFFGPIGKFFSLLTNVVCNLLNAVMGAIDSIVKGLTFGMASIGWEPMQCVSKLFSPHNHTAGHLGKHYLRAEDDIKITQRVADALEWNGTSVCDHFMTAAAEYKYTELRPLERAKWFECIEYKLIGVEIAKFLDAPTFPQDIMYNWKRKYILMYDAVRATKLILEKQLYDKMNWGDIRLELYDHGLDADLYIRMFQKIHSIGGQIVHAVDVSGTLEMLAEHIDPKYSEKANPSATAHAWRVWTNAVTTYQTATHEWDRRGMTKQTWAAIDASSNAHTHLRKWWSTLGTEEGGHPHDTERVFSNLKSKLSKTWSEKLMSTGGHNKGKMPWLGVPIRSGIKSCAERGDPGWCTNCNILDNAIETIIVQGEAMGSFYSKRLPIVLNNVSAYFNDLAEYNEDFFDAQFSKLQSEPDIPKNSIRWTYHVAADWEMLFSDGTKAIFNSSHREIFTKGIEKFLAASRDFLVVTDDTYVPFYGYSFTHMYEFIVFGSCDMDASIFVTTTTEMERVERIDTAILTAAILILFIVTNTTWSVIPLVWIANTVVMATIVNFLYLYIVYGYMLTCSPLLPYTLIDDINAWFHLRINPGCFYKNFQYLANNATDDTCLTCAAPQTYKNCAEYSIINYEPGMLPLSEFIEEYNIFWPSLFWVRWKWPEVAKFIVRNGLVTFESVLGRLFMGAWQDEPIDPIWVDCYHAMWLDNILVGAIVALAAYVSTKMAIIAIQIAIQSCIFVMYLYTTLGYISLTVEQSVVIE